MKSAGHYSKVDGSWQLSETKSTKWWTVKTTFRSCLVFQIFSYQQINSVLKIIYYQVSLRFVSRGQGPIMADQNRNVLFKSHCLVLEVIDKKWSTVSQQGQNDNIPKEIQLCFADDSKTWRLHSNCVRGEVLVQKIDAKTRAIRHEKGFIIVDKYGLKFKDVSQADNFFRMIEKAK